MPYNKKNMPRIDFNRPQIEDKVKNKPTVHNVLILDGSGSMGDSINSKWTKAIDLANSEIISLRSNEDINYTFTIVVFSGFRDINFKHFVNHKPKFISGNRVAGMTALNDAIGKTLNKIHSFKNEDEKVLVKIITDGEENNSKEYSSQQIGRLIKGLQKTGNYTITFVGTYTDVLTAQSLYNIHETNTLVHDNTEEGFEMMSMDIETSNVNYSKRLLRGEDVTMNYFSKTVTN